jgi:clathrin heavy chain
MEHIKLFWSRLNIPTLLSACQENLLWAECVFLYSHYDQYDNAVDMLITHSAECWSHDLFKATLKQVANVEIYYKGVDFYLSEHPLLTNDLLLDLVSQLDSSRVVNIIKPTGKLPLIQKYLLHVQHQNKREVNDAINKLHIEDGNHKALKKSVDEFNEFDLIALASQLENHPLLEFRRISAYLFKVGKKWERAMAISKKDNLWSDTMETTADSGNPEMAEELLTYFVKEDNKECFAACLFVCFELIRVDVVLELAWRHSLTDYAMPFMIQAFRDFDTQIRQLNSKFKSQEDVTRSEEEKKKKSEEEEQRGAASYVGISGFSSLVMPLALPQPGAAYGPPAGNFGPPVGNFGPPPGSFGPPPGSFGGPMGFARRL